MSFSTGMLAVKITVAKATVKVALRITHAIKLASSPCFPGKKCVRKPLCSIEIPWQYAEVLRQISIRPIQEQAKWAGLGGKDSDRVKATSDALHCVGNLHYKDIGCTGGGVSRLGLS